MKPWTAASIWERAMPMSPAIAVVELAKAFDGNATGEMAHDFVAKGAEQPRNCAVSLRHRGPDDG